MFSDPNIHFRTEVRSYPKNVPTVFLKNRSFGGVEPPEGVEIVPDILTQIFLEIRILAATGAGSDQPCSARLGPSQNGRIFLENRKGSGANLQGCCRRDELGLATPTSRRPLRSRPPLGRASFLPGRVGKGVISGKLEKKVLSAVSR